jgi:hypothetical protein
MNMKTKSVLVFVACAALLTTTWTSCSSDDELDNIAVEEVSKTTPTVCSMKFVGGVKGYADASGAAAVTRAESTSVWKEGDKVYLQFTNGSKIVPGEAVYSSSGWTVSYYGDIVSGTKTKCEAYFFDGESVVSSSSSVDLTENSAIYQDLNGSYTLSGNNLTVEANLTPKLGRIRFTGAEKDSIWLTGLKVNSKYDINTNKFITSSEMVTAAVDSTGSTPYLYVELADTTLRNVGILTNKETAFTRKFDASVLAAAATGYMAIPTESSHNRWSTGLTMTASGVEFKMIPVPGYTGGRYCIAETETTTELYNTVYGSSSSMTQYPIRSVSWSTAVYFCSALTSQLGVTFRLPTNEEWLYAAKGGNKSKGYTYSGSNNINDVAWYSGNSSSYQVVKQKQPNELGIYDMSGNVSEWTSTKYNSSYYYYCGGSYANSSSNCVISSYESYGSSSISSVGFRVVMPY